MASLAGWAYGNMDALADRRFDRFVVEPGRRRLLIDGVPAKIGARAFDVLLALIERRKRVVSKSELLDAVWPQAAVEEGNLQVQIFGLRKLLGAGVIATVPGRGYQFAAVIEGEEPPAAGLTSGVRLGRPAEAEIRPRRGNLPPRLPALYGREADKSALTALIGGSRLVSVVGPGGIGKTRLAQAVAHEWRGAGRDGAWLVELAPIERPDLVVSTVARALGHTLGPKECALFGLAEAMGRQELLLVLDNCEHLTDAVAELARAVLAGAPGIRLLVTSQEPLRLPEERVYRLGPLAVPASADAATALRHGAVALFVARAQAADARFKLDEGNVGEIVETCAGLDGVALAIELAAARVSLLGVRGVRSRLDERLRLLAGGPREALPRHRALSAALEWSYGLLCDEERRALDRLGVFVGGFSLGAAQQVIVDPSIDEWSALEHLSALVDKSLVIADTGEAPRYRLLETTRAFALQRLAAVGALAATRRKHALAVVATLRSQGFAKSSSGRAIDFAPDIDNLRAAAVWALGPDGDREIAIALAAESGFIWHVLGLNDEGASLFAAVGPSVDGTTSPVLAAAFRLSRAKLYPSATRAVAEDGMKAADVFRSIGDGERLFESLTGAASQFIYAGDFAAAGRALTEARAVRDPQWPRWTEVAYDIVAGGLKYWAGELAEARRRLRATLELSRDASDASQTEWIEMMIVGCDVGLRNSREAVRAGREMLARADPPIRGFNRAVTENFVAAALAQTGELDEAESSLRAALPRVKRALGTVRTALCYVSFLLARQGRYADAARLLGAVDGLRPSGAAILAPPNRACYDDAAAIASQALGVHEFERLKSEGGRLSEDEAVALAFPDGESVIRRRALLPTGAATC